MRDRLIAFLTSYDEELVEAGRQLESVIMPELTEELFAEFECTGNRLGYENIYFMRRKFLSVFGRPVVIATLS